MNFEIGVDKVKSVLLADGWHDIAGASFNVGAYEYVYGGAAALGGQSGGSSTGFGFREPSGDHLYGPLTAILAVRIVRRDA